MAEPEFADIGSSTLTFTSGTTTSPDASIARGSVVSPALGSVLAINARSQHFRGSSYRDATRTIGSEPFTAGFDRIVDEASRL